MSFFQIHFEEEHWEKTREDGTKKLRCNAVPTLFKHVSKVKKRKRPMQRTVSVETVTFPDPLDVSYKIDSELCEMEIATDVDVHVGYETDSEPFEMEITTDTDANVDLSVPEVPDCKKDKLINRLLNALSKKDKQVLNLKRKLKSQANRTYNASKKRIEPDYLKCAQKVFRSDQCLAMKKKSMRFRKWSNQTVNEALGLKFTCGQSGYENVLYLNLPYPSIRTLQRRLENLKFESGILTEVFDFMKIKIDTMKQPQEKECVLLLDEMSLTESVDYDTSTSSYFGNVTLPFHELQANVHANHALVFMLGGISTRWKQTVAYYYTSSSVDGSVLKKIILEIITLAEKLGLKVNSVTSDMGSVNQAMWKSFGIVCGQHVETSSSIVHPLDDTRTIDFLADVPHLLINIRTCLISNKHFIIPREIQKMYSLPSQFIDSKYLTELVDFQEKRDLKLAHKLTSDHLDDKHFDKMKVSRATTVLSHDVSCGIKFIAEESKDDSGLTTAWFIELVSKWFSLMTSRNPVMALSKFNKKEYHDTIKFLEEVIVVFRNLRIVGNNNKVIWKPIQTGVILSTTSILNLQQKFLDEKKFKFLMTSRFTQDCLENLFSVIRTKQVVPTALQFKNNLKLVCVAQYLKKSSKGSYDVDDRDFLSGFLDVVKEKVHKPAENIQLPENWDKSHAFTLDNSEQNALYNIAGYIISRVKNNDSICNLCVNALGSKLKNDESYATFVSTKEFKDKCLFYANKKTFAFFLKMELIFRSLEAHLLSLPSNVKQLVNDVIDADVEIIKVAYFPKCHFIKKKLQERFVNFRLKVLGLKKKRSIKKMKKGKKSIGSSLGSKSVAMRAMAAAKS